VAARIKGCKKFKGVRALLYRKAQEHFSFCVDGTHDQCIRYDDNDLILRLGFEQKEQAFHIQNLLWVTVINLSQLGVRISANQYDATAFDSPAQTLDDAIDTDTSSLSSNHTVALDSELAQYQSIEHFAALRAGGVDSAHIWPSRECTKAEQQDVNNFLALSKTLHSAFDGPHGGQHGVPTIAIRPLQLPSSTAAGAVRQRVEIAVECQDAEVFKYVRSVLKIGSSIVEGENGSEEFHTWVDVPDPQAFCNYLQKTYNRTREHWRV
jgi:hypothetical protein